MVSRSDPTTHLLLDFMKLRVEGYSPDDAWDIIMKEAQNLSDQEVKNLLNMAKDWEKREGYKYRAKPQNAVRKAAPTTMLDPKVLEQIEQAVKQKRPAPEETSPLVPIEPATQEDYFGATSKAQIFFKDFPETVLNISIKPGQEIIIGRISPNSVMLPDIDLTAVKGENYGVSRLHATLTSRDNHLYLADLGSANRTYLNGDKLHPHETRLLKDGDIIAFADLVTKIHFVHP